MSLTFSVSHRQRGLLPAIMLALFLLLSGFEMDYTGQRKARARTLNRRRVY